VLGEDGKEKRNMEKAAELFPDLPQQLAFQVRYNARRGSAADVQRVFQEILARHNPPQFNSTSMILGLVSELEFHGRLDEARAILVDVVDWLRRRPAAERRIAGNRGSLAYSLAGIGECAAARSLSDSLAATDSTRVGITARGIIAAKCGDTAKADSVSALLGDMELPYLRGDNVLGRARIAAAQGKKREAVQFLLDAVAQGVPYTGHFHQFAEFAILRDYEPFKAAMRSKD
jgi:hypothetical protein